MLRGSESSERRSEHSGRTDYCDEGVWDSGLLESLRHATVDHDGGAARAVAAAVGDGRGAAVEAGGAKAACVVSAFVRS